MATMTSSPRPCAFVTAGRDAEARLVELLGEVDQTVADRIRLRLALGLTVAEVEAARVADVRMIDGAGFLAIDDPTRGRVRLLPLGALYGAVALLIGRASGGRLFLPEDAAATARAFAHAATEFPGISDEAVTDHYAHRTGAPKSSHARREAAFIAAGRMPPGFGWF